MELPGTGIAFRDEGPLAGLVLAYLCQMHGFNEIASRSVWNEMVKLPAPDVQAGLDRLHAEGEVVAAEAMRRIASAGKTALLADMTLASQVGHPIAVDADVLAAEIHRAHKPAVVSMNPLATGALLIVAWEQVKDLSDKSSIWEFLRHCRNAAAHRGRFHFRDGEPKRKAEWRGLEVIAAMAGQLLFTDGVVPGFLAPGDVLHLLADIDRLLPFDEP